MMASSKWIRLLGAAAGIVNILVGLALAVVGLGFANSTGCGTGIGFAFVGIWMVLSSKAVSQGRQTTLIGLAVAWVWLTVRVVMDFPAVASSMVLFLFLIPAPSLSVGGIWILLTIVWGVLMASRLVGILKRDGISHWPGRTLIVTSSLLAVLVGFTFAMPALSWNLRGKQIADLAKQYGSANPTRMVPATFGACSMSFLGYSLTQHGAENTRDEVKRNAIHERVLGDAAAELASAKLAGARYFRVGASGDHLMVSKPGQEEIDDRYVAAIRKEGIALVLVDTQHPDFCRKRKLEWAEFCRFQQERINYYQSRYQPEVYMVVCEPMSYHGFVLTRETQYSGTNWAKQLTEMCKLVKSINPGTRTGICLLVMAEKEPEWQVWSRMRNLAELDILSVEIYQPQDFATTEQRLNKYGHPRETGKQFWIAETYNGWALNGARRWEQDAEWLKVAADFARVTDADAVLVWSFCTFVPGGSFWDFGSGRLRKKWADGTQLSLVGQTFLELSRSSR